MTMYNFQDFEIILLNTAVLKKTNTATLVKKLKQTI